jgi:hypothetical protein
MMSFFMPITTIKRLNEVVFGGRVLVLLLLVGLSSNKGLFKVLHFVKLKLWLPATILLLLGYFGGPSF